MNNFFCYHHLWFYKPPAAPIRADTYCSRKECIFVQSQNCFEIRIEYANLALVLEI